MLSASAARRASSNVRRPDLAAVVAVAVVGPALLPPPPPRPGAPRHVHHALVTPSETNTSTLETLPARDDGGSGHVYASPASASSDASSCVRRVVPHGAAAWARSVPSCTPDNQSSRVSQQLDSGSPWHCLLDVFTSESE